MEANRSLSMNDGKLSLHRDDGHEALQPSCWKSPHRFPGMSFPYLKRHWKHFSNVSDMIDCSFIKNDRLVTLPWNTQPTKPSLSQEIFVGGLYATPFISFDSADCPYTIIFGVVDPIYVETVSRPRTESSSYSLFENVFVSQFDNIFFFSLYVPRLVVVRLLVEEAGQIFNIRRTLVREIFSSTANFRLVTFILLIQARCFTFLIDSFVRMVRERPGDVDSSIEAVSRIILRPPVRLFENIMHHLNAEIFPMDLHFFRTLKVPVFANLYFSTCRYERTRQSYMLFCRESNGEYFGKKSNSLGWTTNEISSKYKSRHSLWPTRYSSMYYNVIYLDQYVDMISLKNRQSEAHVKQDKVINLLGFIFDKDLRSINRDFIKQVAARILSSVTFKTAADNRQLAFQPVKVIVIKNHK